MEDIILKFTEVFGMYYAIKAPILYAVSRLEIFSKNEKKIMRNGIFLPIIASELYMARSLTKLLISGKEDFYSLGRN